jgi:hypothetical protein
MLFPDRLNPFLYQVFRHSAFPAWSPKAFVLTFLISIFPTGGQIQQPIRSQHTEEGQRINENRFDKSGIRFITPNSYNWSATILGAHVTGPQTLEFNDACPSGVFGNDVNLWLMVDDDSEVTLSTGKGSCVPGSEGTIKFNLTGTYNNPKISSASTGIYEGLVDAQASKGTGDLKSNFHVVFGPSNPPSGLGALDYPIYAPVTIPNGIADIDGSGASIDCASLDQCFKITRIGELTIHGFRFWTSRISSDAIVTQTSCSSNVATIYTKLNPPIGSWVDVQNTDNAHYWGIHQVTTTSTTNWTYSDKNCGGLSNIAETATVGGNAREHSAIDDVSGQGVTLRDIYFDAPSGTRGAFTSLVVVIADQGFQADHIYGASHRLLCDASYCGQGFYGPGNFAIGPAIGFLNNIDLSFACSGNGIKWLTGNGLTIQNSVIQAFSEFSVLTGNPRGGYGKTTENFVYNEVGCANPLYTAVGLSGICGASPASGCSASGTNVLGGVLVSTGDIPGMSGSNSGGVPVFASGGTTTYNYYVIIQEGSKVSVPLFFGSAAPRTSGSYRIGWPRYASQTNGAVSYHILKTTGAGYARSAPIADGAPRSVAITEAAIPQCATQVCTIQDSSDTRLQSYEVSKNPELVPNLPGWPGSVILGGGARAYVDDVADFVTTTSADPVVFSKRCSGPTPGVNIVCAAGYSAMNNNTPVGALMLKEGINAGGDAVNRTGRLVFQYAPAGAPDSTELITLVPASPGTVLADANHRPSANPKDTWLGLDTGSTPLVYAGLAGSAPTSIDWCVSQTPADCRAHAIQRITSTNSVFSVPLAAPALISSGTLFKTNLGCNEKEVVGAATAGSFRAGSTNCTTVVTMGAGLNAPNGWACSVWDVTNSNRSVKQTASSKSFVTFAGIVEVGDKLVFSCQGF